MIITLREMINTYYDGDRTRAAKAAGIKDYYQINNLICRNVQVARLDNGDWIMLTKTSKIFKKNDMNN